MKVRRTNSDQKPNIALLKFQTKNRMGITIEQWRAAIARGGGARKRRKKRGKDKPEQKIQGEAVQV